MLKMICEDCGGEYSATYGDYSFWGKPDSEQFTCECGGKCVLSFHGREIGPATIANMREWEQTHPRRPEIDESDLDPRFHQFYKTGERVEATLKDGHAMLVGYGRRTDGRVLRFYVGRSTGSKPIYLMILKRNSYGGMAIPSESIESVRGLGTRR